MPERFLGDGVDTLDEAGREAANLINNERAFPNLPKSAGIGRGLEKASRAEAASELARQDAEVARQALDQFRTPGVENTPLSLNREVPSGQVLSASNDSLDSAGSAALRPEPAAPRLQPLAELGSTPNPAKAFDDGTSTMGLDNYLAKNIGTPEAISHAGRRNWFNAFYQKWVTSDEVAETGDRLKKLVSSARGAAAAGKSAIYGRAYRISREGNVIPNGKGMQDILGGVDEKTARVLRGIGLAERQIELGGRVAQVQDEILEETARIIDAGETVTRSQRKAWDKRLAAAKALSNEENMGDAHNVLRGIEAEFGAKKMREARALRDELFAPHTGLADRAILQPLADLGVISMDELARIREMNQFYIPFERVRFSEFDEVLRDAGTKSPLHKITKGLTDEDLVLDPIESLMVKIQKTHAFVAKQHKRNALVEEAAKNTAVGRQLAKELELGEKVGTFPVWVDGVREDIPGSRALLDALDIHNPKSIRTLMNALNEPILGAKSTDNILKRVVSGEQLRRVKDAASKGETYGKLIYKPFNFGARALRTGITAGLEFTGANWFKDQPTAFLFNKYGYIPFYDSLRGIAGQAMRRRGYGDEVATMWERFVNAGGMQATIVDSDRRMVEVSLARVFRGRDKNAKDLARTAIENWHEEGFLYPLQVLAAGGELGTRFGAFTRGAMRADKGKGLAFLPSVDEAFKYWQKTKSLKGATTAFKSARGRVPSDLDLMLHQGRDITVDFGRSGDYGAAWSAVEAFGNPMIQGADRFARALRDQPITTMIRGVGVLTVPTVLTYMLNRDNPDYHNVEEYEKQMNLNLWQLDNGRFARLPMPPGMETQVFSYTTRKFLEWADGVDPSIVDEIASGLLEEVPGLHHARGLDFLPTAIQPIVEASVGPGGYSEFRDAELIPKGLQYPNVRPEEQFTDGTSQTVRALSTARFPEWVPGLGGSTVSEKLPFLSRVAGSPIRAQHVLRGLTGTVGQSAVNLSDKLFFDEQDRGIPNPKDTFMLGRFMSGPSIGVGSKPLNEFWKLADMVTAEDGTFEKRIEELRIDEAIDKADFNVGALEAFTRTTRDKISSLIKQRRTVVNSDLDLAERVEFARIYDQMMTDYAASTLQMARDMGVTVE